MPRVNFIRADGDCVKVETPEGENIMRAALGSAG